MKNIILLKWFPFLYLEFISLNAYDAYFNYMYICICDMPSNEYLFNARFMVIESNLYEKCYKIMLLI